MESQDEDDLQDTDFEEKSTRVRVKRDGPPKNSRRFVKMSKKK